MPHCDPVGLVHSLESFGSVDGPGVRFVVFLQGCALRCKYCHNPETWSAEGGTEWSPEKLFQHVWRYRNYWGKKGGITVSGGEPLRQMDFLTKFFQLARAKGVHTALDTAGQPFQPDDPAYLAAFDTLMASTSLVILDLKEIDPEKHRQLTGRDNANILAMARHISDLGVPLWIRHVLVPGLTDDEEGLRRTADFIRSLKTVQRVEVLPYHTLGLFKWQKLGISYPMLFPPRRNRSAGRRNCWKWLSTPAELHRQGRLGKLHPDLNKKNDPLYHADVCPLPFVGGGTAKQ